MIAAGVTGSAGIGTRFIGSGIAVTTLRTRFAALIRRRTMRIVTGIDRHTSASQRMGPRRPAVCRQRPEIHVGHTHIDPVSGRDDESRVRRARTLQAADNIMPRRLNAV